MSTRDDDEDEGELKEAPAHSRGGTRSEVDEDEGGKAKPKPRIDDPDQPKPDGKRVEVDGEIVEVIEDLDTMPKDDEPKKRQSKDDDDEDEKDETRGKRRRRDRKAGREKDREELRTLLSEIGGLKAEVKSLREGQRAGEEQSEATLLANTRAALNTVMAQRAEAIANNDPRANELDEAVYRLRRQRDDLETSIERRERGDGKDDRGGDPDARGTERPRWTQPELRTIRTFIDDEIPWFDPNGGDRDSRKALDISKEMGDDDWRPSDPGWKKELRERLQEALPHRFEDDQDDDGRAPKRRSPPVGGRGREGGSGGGSGKFQLRLTDAHKQALADSGHERGSPEYNSIIATWVREAKATRAQR